VLNYTEGSYEDARSCFEQAISLNPMYEDALFNIRDVCRQLNDYRAASEFGRILSALQKQSGTPLQRKYR
jgi:tetratricopeptide (TPR) repeat protein